MMKEVPPEHKPNLPGYFSFLLRCWMDDDGQVHARLIDIRTNAGYVVGNLTLLPDLLHRLVTNAADAEKQADAYQSIDHS